MGRGQPNLDRLLLGMPCKGLYSLLVFSQELQLAHDSTHAAEVVLKRSFRVLELTILQPN